MQNFQSLSRAALLGGACLALTACGSTGSPWTGAPTASISFVPLSRIADPAHVTGLLEAAGFKDVGVHPHSLELELPEDSVVDDTQLAFIGIAPERMDEARRAVDAHMAQFRLPSGLNRFPLAFQIVTAQNG